MNILAGAFVGLDEVKASLGLSDADPDRDGLLVALINRSTGLFKQYTGRNLLRTSYVDQRIDGSGEESVFLPEYPVISVGSVKYSETREFSLEAERVIFDGTGSQAADAFEVTFDSVTGELGLLNGDVWPEGSQTVLVSYVAGYDAVNAQDLVQAQCTQVAAWWFAVGRDPKLTASSLGGVTSQLFSPTLRLGDLTDDVRATLFAYRRPACVA